MNPTGGHIPSICRCKTCPALLTTKEFVSHITGEKHLLKNKVTCKSSNVIYMYMIQCALCGQQYVGETGQPLHARLNNHLAHITHKRVSEKPVAAHFNKAGHSLEDLRVMVIEKLHRDDPLLRKIREYCWIMRQTAAPHGINLRTDHL